MLKCKSCFPETSHVNEVCSIITFCDSVTILVVELQQLFVSGYKIKGVFSRCGLKYDFWEIMMDFDECAYIYFFISFFLILLTFYQ